MADDPQEKSDALDTPEERHIMTKAERRFQQYEDINYLLEHGETKTAIAERMGISLKTLHNMIHEYRGMELSALYKDAVQRSARQVVNKLSKITEMALDETLRKKDHQAALGVVRDAGVLDMIRPAEAKRPTDDSHITFEFNFPPPPWAPRAVIEASKPKQIEAKSSEAESELQAEPSPVDVSPRD